MQVTYTDGARHHRRAIDLSQRGAGGQRQRRAGGHATITGTPTEDQTLTANTAGISDADGLGAFSYQWLREWCRRSVVRPAVTYTLGDADVGAQITVQVSYTDGHGTAEEPLTSAPTAAVANVNDAAGRGCRPSAARRPKTRP